MVKKFLIGSSTSQTTTESYSEYEQAIDNNELVEANDHLLELVDDTELLPSYEEYQRNEMSKSCREGCKAAVKEAVKEAFEEMPEPQWKTKIYAKNKKGTGKLSWKDRFAALLLLTVPLISMHGMFEKFEFNAPSKFVLISIVIATSFYAIGSWKGESRKGE